MAAVKCDSFLLIAVRITQLHAAQRLVNACRQSCFLDQVPFHGNEPLPALGTRDPFRVDPADLVRRNRAPTLRADCVEGRHHFSEIDFLLLGHLKDFLTPEKPTATQSTRELQYALPL